MKNKVMGRAVLGLGFAWFVAMGATAVVLPGCATEAAEKESDTGLIDFALSGTSSSGILNRLRDAQIDISGAASTSISTEDFLDQFQVSLELPAGGYLADLLPGWRLEREVDGVFEDVRAVLLSTDPLPFVVFDQQTTDVRLLFRAGDDVVELGNGRVLIGIDVIDENGPPPPGDCGMACEEAQALGCPTSDVAFCIDICSNLPALAPGCEPFAEEYVMCAQGVPGSDYVCYPEGYPIAAPCEPLFQQVIDCLTTPTCTADNDGDGVCVEQDCNDADASIFPGAMDGCGDGIDQNCDGSDAVCGWNCNPQYYGSVDGCDCGCGIPDPDCSSPDVSVCEYCDDAGSCSPMGMGCPGTIKPSDNATCF